MIKKIQVNKEGTSYYRGYVEVGYFGSFVAQREWARDRARDTIFKSGIFGDCSIDIGNDYFLTPNGEAISVHHFSSARPGFGAFAINIKGFQEEAVKNATKKLEDYVDSLTDPKDPDIKEYVFLVKRDKEEIS